MKNESYLPEPSAPWGRAISETVDANAAGIKYLENDLDVRFRGLSAMAQSLTAQTNAVGAAIADAQVVAMAANPALNITVGTEGTPVAKATVSFNVPAGYSGAIVEAQGSGYVQHALGGLDLIESDIWINGDVSAPQTSPIQDASGMRYYKVRALYSTFLPLSGTLTVQFRMRHRNSSVVLNNGANTATLAVLVNFYKGSVLQPPA